MEHKQKFFGKRSIIFMLALLGAFPPLSTDLYMPALPHMVKAMNTSQTAINLTLSLFILFFSLGILIWGPLSEKYGRKPILLLGLIIYTIASLCCGLSSNVTQLIIARIFQGLGGGAAEAIATALVKDMYTGKKREFVLAVVMAMVIVAPVTAPVIGALILKVTSWRTIFFALAGISGFVFIMALLLDETLEDKYSGSILSSIGRLGVVLKNPGFSVLLVIFSMLPMSLMAFIAASSFIYIDKFGMTEELYSYYFAFNAIGAMIGPVLFLKISKRINSWKIITTSFFTLVLCGIIITTRCNYSPVLFAFSMLIATFAISMVRPPSANLLLAQQEKDTGSASSLINFMALFMGSMGMIIISLEQDNLISCLGVMQIVIGSVCGVFWVMVKGKPFIKPAEEV